MPAAGWSRATSRAARAPAGWNAATPRPETSTQANTAQKSGANAIAPTPSADARMPAGRIQRPPPRSERAPNSGCTRLDETVRASTSAPTWRYERPCSSRRYGSSAGTAPWAKSTDAWPTVSGAMRRPSVATRGEGTVVAATTGIVRHRGAGPQPAIDMSLTVLEGNTFFVCDDDGNATAGSEGLYANDVRYVSLWRMTLDGLPPKLLGTGAQGHFQAASYGYKAAYAGRGAPEVATLRRFFVSDPHVPGGAGGRQQRPRARDRARALRVRLRLPRPVRGQVAGVRPARPRLRRDHHAAADRAPLRRRREQLRLRRGAAAASGPAR